MATNIQIKKPFIVFDFWGTLAKLKTGPDFGIQICQLLGIPKKEYLRIVQEQWFVRQLSANRFADVLIEVATVSPVSRQELICWILNPISRAVLYPDAMGCLEGLSRRHKLFLVSDNSSNGIVIIEKLHIRHFFSDILLSCCSGVTKANGLYQKFFTGVPPEDAVVIGDSITADLEPAKACGAKVIHLNRNCDRQDDNSINTLGALS